MKKKTAMKLGLILAVFLPILGWYQRDRVLNMVADVLWFAGKHKESEAMNHRAFLIRLQRRAERAFGEDCVWISVPSAIDASVVEVLLDELGPEGLNHFGHSSVSPGGRTIVFVPERRREAIVKRLKKLAGP